MQQLMLGISIRHRETNNDMKTWQKNWSERRNYYNE